MSATQLQIRFLPRRPLTQTLSVLIGYVLSFFIAGYAVYLLDAWRARPEAQAYQGMSAGGDMILVLFLFGCLAAIPTFAGLFFLRPYPRMWEVLSTAALVLAATGLGALGGVIFGLESGWGLLSVLRVLLTPGFALALILAAIMAPIRRARVVFLSAAINEALVCVLTLLHLFARR